MHVQLMPLQGGEPIVLTKDIALVGRKEGCDLRLNHRSISKQHCVLVKADGLILLRDLGSTNGTRVNGKRVRRAALTANDQLSIASLSFRLLFDTTPRGVPVSETTQQISSEEAERLFSHSNGSGVHKPPVDPPLVKVNALPDAYTPVAEPGEEE
jgi:pSer/pThr/pTyr-binding forkhead associated (FHA) protein